MADQQQSRYPWRMWSYRILVAIFVLGLIGSTVAIWADARIQDSDDWAATVGPLAKDPTVQDYIISEASAVIDRQIAADEDAGRLRTFTRSQLSGIVHIALDDFVTSPTFASWWIAANREAHNLVWQVLGGDEGSLVQTSGGEIQLDLQPAIDWTNQQLQSLFPNNQYTISLPPDRAIITLYSSESLQTLTNVINLVANLAFYLPIVALVSLVGAMMVAQSKLSAMLQIGLVITVSMVGIILVLWFSRMWIVSQQPEANQDVLDAVIRIVLKDLITGFRVLAVVGLILVARVIVVKWVKANWQQLRGSRGVTG